MEHREDAETQPYTPIGTAAVGTAERQEGDRLSASAMRRPVEWEWLPAQRPGAAAGREQEVGRRAEQGGERGRAQRDQMEGRLRKAMFGGLALGGLILVLRVVSAVLGGGSSPEPVAALATATRQALVASTGDSLAVGTPLTQTSLAQGTTTFTQPTPAAAAGAGLQSTALPQVSAPAGTPRSGTPAVQPGNATPVVLTPVAQIRGAEVAGSIPGAATSALSGGSAPSLRATIAPGALPATPGTSTSGSASTLAGTGSTGTASLGSAGAAGSTGAVGGASGAGSPGTSGSAAPAAGSDGISSAAGASTGSVGVAVAPGGAVAVHATATPAAPPAGGRTYTVRSGDTLYAIALRYNTTVDALVASNGLRTAETILAIGQKLVLP